MPIFFWLSTALFQTVYMLPLATVAGLLSPASGSAPPGSLERDLE